MCACAYTPGRLLHTEQSRGVSWDPESGTQLREQARMQDLGSFASKKERFSVTSTDRTASPSPTKLRTPHRTASHHPAPNHQVISCTAGRMNKQSGGRQQIFRAKFSAVTRPDIERAMRTLGEPNENESLAVDARQELDLKLGVAFSRFQTRCVRTCARTCARACACVRACMRACLLVCFRCAFVLACWCVPFRCCLLRRAL